MKHTQNCDNLNLWIVITPYFYGFVSTSSQELSPKLITYLRRRLRLLRLLRCFFDDRCLVDAELRLFERPSFERLRDRDLDLPPLSLDGLRKSLTRRTTLQERVNGAVTKNNITRTCKWCCKQSPNFKYCTFPQTMLNQPARSR